jgi:GH25 family lysozyme M1 (1,4-beta-N-acetylmuramidase)
MKFQNVLPFVAAAAAIPFNATEEDSALEKRAVVYGFDISHYQSSVDFNAAYNSGGLRFVYIKVRKLI